MSWKDDKNLGPWSLDKASKLGYLNNPKFSDSSTIIHRPCGYWYNKDKDIKSVESIVDPSCLPSVDCYVDGDHILIFYPMWLDLGAHGVVSQVYDTNGNVWIDGLGMSYPTGSPRWSTIDYNKDILLDAVPFVANVASQDLFGAATRLGDYPNYSLYFKLYRHGETSLHLINNGIGAASKDIYTVSYEKFYMDSIGNVVIPGSIYLLNTESNISVFTSHDYGNTFSQVLKVAHGAFYAGRSSTVQIDSVGNLYLGYSVAQGTNPATFYLYKSTDLGDTWVLVNSFATTNYNGANLVVDGTNLYLLDNCTNSKFYISTNGGVNFNLLSTLVGYTGISFDALDGTICISPTSSIDAMLRSEDGINWTTISPPPTFGGVGFRSLTSIRAKSKVWVATTPQYNIDDRLAFIISTNNGVTWDVVKSTVTYAYPAKSKSYYTVYLQEPDYKSIWTI